ITLILPDSWKGKYAVEHSVSNYSVYIPRVREALGGDSETYYSGGSLFYIMLWSQQITKEQFDQGGEWNFAACRYIMTTDDGTYLLYRASDVQYPPDDPELSEMYLQMDGEVRDIKIVVEDVLAD
ncbi:MAG: hypothetical protein IJ017_09305, partial [Oscillospiraceae bacterium]|nr:hypothetical protein [Oscillospiraceae bacterium]